VIATGRTTIRGRLTKPATPFLADSTAFLVLYMFSCMWKRYTHDLTSGQIVHLYRLTLPEAPPSNFRPNYNVAPTDAMPIIRPIEGGGRELVVAGWSLVPSWLKSLDKKSYSTFNARAETVRTAASFRKPFQSQRCIVPASGWYEWQAAGEKQLKRPHYFTVDQKPWAFAGLWDRWRGDGGPGFVSFTIIVCEPSPAVAPYHNRMPVILTEDQFDIWMLGTPDEAAPLMKPFDGPLQTWEVGRRVGNVKFNDSDLIKPLQAGALL